jgi:hypothetical protein
LEPSIFAAKAGSVSAIGPIPLHDAG